MDNQLNKVIDVLKELQVASQQATEHTIRSVMDKYDMLFLGEEFKVINTLELRYSLNNYFHVDMSNEELNTLIPAACEFLQMKYEPMIKLEDAGKNNIKPHCYTVTLW